MFRDIWRQLLSPPTTTCHDHHAELCVRPIVFVGLYCLALKLDYDRVSLYLDPQIRDWVLFPITLVMVRLEQSEVYIWCLIQHRFWLVFCATTLYNCYSHHQNLCLDLRCVNSACTMTHRLRTKLNDPQTRTTALQYPARNGALLPSPAAALPRHLSPLDQSLLRRRVLERRTLGWSRQASCKSSQRP